MRSHSGRGDPDLRPGDLDRRARTDLAPPSQLHLVVHADLASLDQCPGVRSVIGDTSQLQELPEPDHVVVDGHVDGVAHVQLAARLAVEKPGPPAYAASRSVEVMAPHTPYGSRTFSACSRQLCMTGQLAHTALAWRSRLRRDGPRSPSGWKKTSGLSRRQDPSSCHCHRSATGPGRRVTSANGVSFDDPARGRCASPSQVVCTSGERCAPRSADATRATACETRMICQDLTKKS